jgi:DNA polymerase-1
VEPEQLVDLFALAGDSSLGIRGIYSIGVHTAVKLLTDYGNLEGVLDAGDTIGGRLGAKVRSGAADARLAARLVALRRDVSLDTNLKAFRFDSNLVGSE